MTTCLSYGLLLQLLQTVYPDLYRVDNLTDEGGLHQEADDSSDDDCNGEIIVPQPERLQVLSRPDHCLHCLFCTFMLDRVGNKMFICH